MHSMERGTAMGGTNANALLFGKLRDHPLVDAIAVTTPDAPKRGADLLVVEAPTGTPFVEGCEPLFTFVLRHGDTPIGHCAYEQFEDSTIALLVPTQWAARGLPRVPFMVQYMALEPPPAELPPLGKKVLHARAFDFMKGTGLALRVATEALEEPGAPPFVFRQSPDVGSFAYDIPPNVEVLPAVGGDALWKDIGCVLLTSRDETFSMIAYEAMCRGIPVVSHASLGALKEWGGPLPFYQGHEQALAQACRSAVRVTQQYRQELHTRACVTYAKAMLQMDQWLQHAQQKVGT
jgi:hypothetical protein